MQTADVTSMRGGKFMSIDDILFLLKRDKVCFFTELLSSLALISSEDNNGNNADITVEKSPTGHTI